MLQIEGLRFKETVAPLLRLLSFKDEGKVLQLGSGMIFWLSNRSLQILALPFRGFSGV